MPIKVFISYSHDSEQHKKWVLTLSNTLRQHGINCQMDQYVTVVEEGWMLWMQQQIENADFVLLVCTKKYLDRFQKHSDGGVGKGVAWEGALLTQIFYDRFSTNKKIIQVLSDDGGNIEHIPLILRAFPYFFIPSNYEGLLRFLTDQPKILPPPVQPNIPNLGTADWHSNESTFIIKNLQHLDNTIKTMSIMMPFPNKSPIFVGRKEEINSIKKFFKSEIQHIYLLIGMGGVGKTTLLANVIEGVKDSSFFYKFSQNSTPSIDDIIAKLQTQYQDFQIPINISLENKIDAVVNKLEISKRYYFFFEDLHNVLDNGRSIHSKILKMFFEKLFCSQSKSKIIITSRIEPKIKGIMQAGTEKIKKIDGLSESCSYDFMFKLRELYSYQNYPQNVLQSLYKVTEGNPEAIRLLLGYSGYTSRNLKNILEGLEEGEFWERLLEEVMESASNSEWILLKIAAIYREPISKGILVHHNKSLTSSSFNELERRCLLTHLTSHDQTDIYYLHELVKIYILEKILSEEEKKKIHIEAGRYYESQKKEMKPKNIEDVYEDEETIYHYFEAQQYEKAVSIRLSGYYHLWGMHETNLRMWKKVEKHLNHDKLAICYLEMGLSHFDMMEYTTAKNFFKKSLKVYRKIENKSSLDDLYASICNFLGEIYRISEDDVNALKCYLESVKFLKKTKNRSGGLGRNYNNIGLILQKQKKYDKALKYYKQAQVSCELKKDNHALAIILVNIAEIHRQNENHDKALNFYVKSRQILEQIGDKLGLAKVYNKTGLTYIEKKEFDNSLCNFIKGKEIIENVDETNKNSQSQLTFIYNNMGGAYFFRGNYNEAWEYYQKSKEACEQINDKSKLAIIFSNISIIRQSRQFKLLPNILDNDIKFLY